MTPPLELPRSLIKPFDLLTSREQQVATGLVHGQPNREIAKQLGCSIKTIDTHRNRMLRKLKVSNNVTLTRLAIATGYVALPEIGQHWWSES